MSDDRLQLMLLPAHIEATVTRAYKPKKGMYAAAPGTGPEGETCGSCKHCWRGRDGRYRKCELVRKLWTHGPGTDIKARSAACSKWEKEEG